MANRFTFNRAPTVFVETREQALIITQFHKNLFNGAIAISTLGASITFQVIIQQIDSSENVSAHHTFHRRTARTFLAISWVLFVSALGIASLAAILLGFNMDRVRRGIERAEHTRYRYDSAASITSGVLLFLIMSAFFFSSLAITSYCEGAGWAGCGISGIFLLLSLWIWIRYMLSSNQRPDIIHPLLQREEHAGIQRPERPPPTKDELEAAALDLITNILRLNSLDSNQNRSWPLQNETPLTNMTDSPVFRSSDNRRFGWSPASTTIPMTEFGSPAFLRDADRRI